MAPKHALTTGLAILVLSCTTAALRMPDPVLAVGDEVQTREAIIKGMAIRGWVVEDEQPGRVLARFERRRHTAKVWIDYTGRQIKFYYAGSENLQCMPEGDSCSSIHRVYNTWTKNLAIDIAKQIDQQRLQLPPPRQE